MNHRKLHEILNEFFLTKREEGEVRVLHSGCLSL